MPSTTEWELISPADESGTPLGDSQVVVLDPVTSGTVYVGMHTGGNGNHAPTDGLYKSTDCGAQWKRITTGRNSDLLITGSQWSMAIDPTDTNVMYTVSGYGATGVWKSSNGGIDWDQIVPADVGQYVPYTFFSGISIDRTDAHHLIASVHTGTCTGAYAPTCLAESLDSGTTWRAVHGPEVAGGGDGAGAYVIDHNTLLYAFPFDGLWVTTDGGANWSKVAGGAWGGGGPLYRAPNGTYYVPGGNGALQSGSDLLTWNTLTAGTMVGFTGSDANLYGGDQWNRSYWTASLMDPTKWSKLTTTGMPMDNQGSMCLAYDGGHHILYSSNFAGGLWRIGAP
jgi:hypothetical protein